MTKERKLAIDMWLWIREHYQEWDEYFWGSGDTESLATMMKCEFLDAEELPIPVWRSMCWLCHYVRTPAPDSAEKFFTCERCPLKTCFVKDSAYRVLDTHTYKGDIHVTEEVYRNCC